LGFPGSLASTFLIQKRQSRPSVSGVGRRQTRTSMRLRSELANPVVQICTGVGALALDRRLVRERGKCVRKTRLGPNPTLNDAEGTCMIRTNT